MSQLTSPKRQLFLQNANRREPLIKLPSLDFLLPIHFQALTEILADSILKSQELLELKVILDDLATSALKVVNEWAPADVVVLASAPRQKIGTVL